MSLMLKSLRPQCASRVVARSTRSLVRGLSSSGRPRLAEAQVEGPVHHFEGSSLGHKRVRSDDTKMYGSFAVASVAVAAGIYYAVRVYSDVLKTGLVGRFGLIFVESVFILSLVSVLWLFRDFYPFEKRDD